MINQPIFQSPVNTVCIYPHIVSPRKSSVQLSSLSSVPSNIRFAAQYWESQDFQTVITFLHLIDVALSESKYHQYFLLTDRPIHQQREVQIKIPDHVDVLFHPERDAQLPMIISKKAIKKMVRSGVRKHVQPMKEWIHSIMKVGYSSDFVNQEDVLACCFHQSVRIGDKIRVPDRMMNSMPRVFEKSRIDWLIDRVRHCLLSSHAYAKISDAISSPIFDVLFSPNLMHFDSYLGKIVSGILGDRVEVETGVLDFPQMFHWTKSGCGSEILMFFSTSGSWWINGVSVKENEMLITCCMEIEKRFLIELESDLEGRSTASLVINRIYSSYLFYSSYC